jgi:hypothetical protein
MLSIWFVQFPSDAKVNPKCLWVFTISTGSPLNRRSKCGTALVEITRALVLYACEVWDGCFEREVAKLEKVQLEN